MTGRPRPTARVLLCGAILAALVGCWEEEERQERTLRLEKGGYAGAPDRPLTDAEVEALRERAQRGAGW